MSDLQFAIRPIDENDLNEWFRLRRALWDGVTEMDHQEEMGDILEHPETQLVLVADIGGGRLAGFLEASIRPFVEDCVTDNVGYLEGWYVDEECRRQGIGRMLVHEAERWAIGCGCSEMASDAEIGNLASLSAHQNLGYQETSRLVHLRKELK